MSDSNAAGRKTDGLAGDDQPLNAVETLSRRMAELEALRGPPKEACKEEAPEDRARDAVMQRTRRYNDNYEPREQPLPAAPIELSEQVYQPDSTKALLNAQLLESVALMRDAGWLYRNSSLMPSDRGDFVSQAIRLMEASAKIGDTIRRLDGGEDPVPTTRHLTVVEYKEGGGGKAPLENE